jgi:hypothetical protein
VTDHRTECLATIDQMRGALCDLADWLDLHPDLNVRANKWSTGTFGIHDRNDFPATVRALTKGAPLGTITKHEQGDNGDTLRVDRDFGAGIKVSVYADRDEVCTARVVGTETVQVPDPDAPMVEVERDLIEWDCAPILSAVDA